MAPYLPPSSSHRTQRLGLDPVLAFTNVLHLLSSSPEPILVMGDLNVRTGELIARRNHPPRASLDRKAPNRQGREVVAACNELDLVILNGAAGEDKDVGLLTAYSHKGNSVIDYAITSSSLVPKVLHFSVSPDHIHSDHCPLLLTLDCSTLNFVPSPPPPPPPRPEKFVPRILTDSPVDKCYEAIWRTRATPQARARKIYGDVLEESEEATVEVWSYGYAEKGDGGVGLGVVFGEGDERNVSAHYSRQSLLAVDALGVLLVLERFRDQPTVPLIIHTSNFLARSLAHWAPTELQSWKAKEKPLVRRLRLLLSLLRDRRATVEFRLVEEGEEGQRVLVLARVGLRTKAPTRRGDEHFPPPSQSKPILLPPIPTQPPPPPKIFTNLPYSPQHTHLPPRRTPLVSPFTDETKKSLRRVLDTLFSNPQFGEDSPVGEQLRLERERIHRRLKQIIQAEKQKEEEGRCQQLLESESEGAFWSVSRKLDCVRAKSKIPITEHTLHHATVLQGPNPLPPFISANVRDANEREYAGWHANPPHNQPLDPSNHLERPIENSEVKQAIAHAEERGASSSAAGADGLSFDEVKGVEIHLITSLLNTIISTQTLPSPTDTNLLIPIPKPGKDPLLASSYRGVTLVPVLLKLLDSILLARASNFATEHSILPESQNGFRAGRRTEGSAFVLNALIEKHAVGRGTVWVASLDATKAFDYVHLPTLWKKMKKMGFSGKIFDTIQMRYNKTKMRVRDGGGVSEEFVATHGVMQGSPLSPFLYLLHISDLPDSSHPDDLTLLGVIINHSEHADDMILISGSRAGLQHRLDVHQRFLNLNSILVNTSKSEVIIFGPKPSVLHPLTLNGENIPFVRSLTTIGMTFDDGSRLRRFDSHIRRRGGNGVAMAATTAHQLGFFSNTTNGQKLTLYKGLLEPTIAFGGVLTIASPLVQTELDHSHRRILRSILPLSTRSNLAPLYLLTDLLPITSIFLSHTLRFLSFLANSPPETFVHLAFLALRDLPDSWYSRVQEIARQHDVELPDDVEGFKQEEWLGDAIERMHETERQRWRTYAELNKRLPLLHPANFPSSTSFHHLLMLPNRRERETLLRLISGEHPLRVEQLRRGEGRVEEEDRVCRYGCGVVEDEGHLLKCKEEVVAKEREVMWKEVKECGWEPEERMGQEGDGRRREEKVQRDDDAFTLSSLIRNPKSASAVAHFIYLALKQFPSSSLALPPRP